MKRITLTFVIAVTFSFVSCKKDRTCTCTYSNTGSSTTYTEITTYDHATKKSTTATCISGTVYDQAHPADIQTKVCDLK
jgi:hypothetical protein